MAAAETNDHQDEGHYRADRQADALGVDRDQRAEGAIRKADAESGGDGCRVRLL